MIDLTVPNLEKTLVDLLTSDYPAPQERNPIVTVMRSRHRRDQCMDCSKKPVVACHWADGRGMAWFCLKHLRAWLEEDERELVGVWFIKDGEMPKDIRKNPAGTVKIRKLGENLSHQEILSRLEKLTERGDTSSGHIITQDDLLGVLRGGLITQGQLRRVVSLDDGPFFITADYPAPHCGLPGEVGGSSPRDECAAGEADVEAPKLSDDERRTGISEIIKQGLKISPWDVANRNYSFWFLPDGSIHIAQNGHWMSARRAIEETGLSIDVLMKELGVEYLGEEEAESAKRGTGFVPILEMLRLGYGRLSVQKGAENINIQIDQPMTNSQKRALLEIYEFHPDYDVYYDVNTVVQYQGPTDQYRSGRGRREFNRLMGVVERVVDETVDHKGLLATVRRSLENLVEKVLEVVRVGGGLGQKDKASTEVNAAPINTEPGQRQANIIEALPEDPKKAIKAGKFDEETTRRILENADKVIEHANDEELRTSPLIQRLAQQSGAHIEGFDYRIKGRDSLARKIATDMIEKNISLEEATSDVYDAVRYTLVFDGDEFVEKVGNVQNTLVAEGWSKYDEKWNNYFTTGDGYDGYNTVMENPETWERFELQFHTPETWQHKMDSHSLYEELRVLPQGSPRRLQIWNQIVQSAEALPRPTGWDRLRGQQVVRQ